MSKEGKAKESSKYKRDSSDEDNTERIRVGKDYQAIMPSTLLRPSNMETIPEKALLMWTPSELADIDLDQYIRTAKEKYGYNSESALGMLFYHKCDIDRALQDLGNFKPHCEEWTTEDQVLFEQAFQFHGKSFNRIRQMLPDKSVAELVCYYYSWKKTRQKTSVMDVQEKNLTKNGGSDNSSEKDSNETSDIEEKPLVPVAIEEKPTSSLLLECADCGVSTSEVNGTPHGKMCHSCYQHFRRTGILRPTTGPSCIGKRYRPQENEKHKRHPPRGIYINHDDIVALATASQSETNKQPDILVGKEREIALHRSAIQNNLQRISSLLARTNSGKPNVTPPDSTYRVSNRWTPEENMLVVQGIKQHGKDFATIAAAIGTKTETQIKGFFVNYRRRYNLDQLVRDLENKNGVEKSGNESELLEIDLDEENTNTNIAATDESASEKPKSELSSASNS